MLLYRGLGDVVFVQTARTSRAPPTSSPDTTATRARAPARYCTVLYCTVLYCTVLYCTVLYCTGQGGDEADNWDYDGSGDYDMGDYKPPCVGACAVIKLSHCCTSIYTIKCKNRN